jgi:hypothetical protein
MPAGRRAVLEFAPPGNARFSGPHNARVSETGHPGTGKTESFVVLAMSTSVEAIFLSTFILISQNRMAAAADKRADLDLQISLLAEHEVTKLVRLVSVIGERLGVQTGLDPELKELRLRRCWTKSRRSGRTTNSRPSATTDVLQLEKHSSRRRVGSDPAFPTRRIFRSILRQTVR